MTRTRLFQIRFAASAALLALAFLLVRFAWFPGGYFALSGVARLFLVLVAVNLVVGPGLSTLLFRPGKWGLKFDLVVVACVEIAILGWAMAQMHERMPAFAVFVVDRFEAVTRKEVDLAKLADQRLASRPGFAPRLIYAELPTDTEVMNRLIDETVFLGMKDIDRRPEFWQRYPQGIASLKAVARPLSRLLDPNDHRAGPLRRWLNRRGAQPAEFIYLPIRVSDGDGIIIVHADIGYPADVLALDPWHPVPGEGESSAAQNSPPAGDVEQTHE